jgi:superfamily II DNA/RNA helicase
LTLALLSDFRVWRSEHESHKKPINPSVSALVIVPHKDLALQLARWIQVITESKIQVHRPELSSVVQVLAKVPGEPLEDRLTELERVTPHILIGTPQVLLNNYDRLKLHKLETVVVDEVDYLIETVPNLLDKFKREKIRKKITKYPGPTRPLLDKILESRMVKPDVSDPGNTPTPTRTAGQPQTHHAPQLILSTATFRSHLSRFLFHGSGWLTRGDMHLVKINGARGKTEPSTWLPNSTHSVLVVNEESEIRNIEGAIASPDPSPVSGEGGEENAQANEEGEAVLRDVVTEELSGIDLGEEDVLASKGTEYEAPPPWSPGSIEAISICFAMDVPRTALLVTPATHPIRRLIGELKGYDVDARPLDMLSPAAGRNHMLNVNGAETVAGNEGPILLVSTLANIRGLDLPDLSHVFVMGMPEGRVDSYTHIAGRTGRFGKSGKIVTIVEKIEEEIDDGKGGRKKRVVKDEERKMRGILREMGIIPRKVDHFD